MNDHFTYQNKLIMNTEFLTSISWLHVFAAAIGYFVLGALWYSALFKKQWIIHSGVNVDDPNAKKGIGAIMVTSFILMFICSLGLAILITKLQIGSLIPAVKLGMLTGICFSMTSISISYIYEKKPLGLHMINGGYNLCGCIIAAIILACWH